jgi:NAD(P)-dependent dehydrogenase (short-subunit alcohol dehydrogenase family)
VPEYDLSGKVALVTGGARGIGFATARALHARGASVAVVDLRVKDAREAAKRIGERAAGFGADVAKRNAIQKAVNQTVDQFGGLDVVVANAGIAPLHPRTTRMTEPAQFERIVEVNLLGVYRTVEAALPQVVERHGHLVLVASVYAFFNGTMNSAYATAKAGVEALGRSLRTELHPHGASATVAYFGFIDTKMVQGIVEEDPLGRRFEEYLPRFLTRRLPPEAAGEALVRGIERRAPRVIQPPYWRAAFGLRGVMNPVLDRFMERDRGQLAELLREADREPEPGTSA